MTPRAFSEMICEWIRLVFDCAFLHAAILGVMFWRFESDRDINIFHERHKKDKSSSQEAVENLNTVGFEGIDNKIDKDIDDLY